MALPRGVVTFLFTDIEGSTRLFTELGDDYLPVLDMHNAVIREALAATGGYEVKTEGDAFFAAFSDPAAALEACLQAQRGLATRDWPHGQPVRVRMGMHLGQVHVVDDDYVGLPVHEAARIAGAAHGGQILVSAAVADAVERLPEGTGLRDLGRHALKDFPEPRPLFQLTHDALPAAFPPPRTLTARDHNLTTPPTPLVGRDADLIDIQTLAVGDTRLVSLIGPGGIGKSRLALEAAWSLLSWFPKGVYFVELAAVAAGEDLMATVAANLNLAEQPGVTPFDAVVAHMCGGPALLVLDNLEQVLEGVVVIAELLAACPDLRVLATSRVPLRLRGEAILDIEPLATTDAVELFGQRASAASRRFALNDETAGLVGDICATLDGIPLAIELAAAMVRTMSLAELLTGLDRSLDLLTEGERDLPARQQTLRSAIAWSDNLLSEDERSVFHTASVFAGGMTVDALAAVHGRPVAAVQPLARALVDRSLMTFADGRYAMLEPIRQFAAERLHGAEGAGNRAATAHAAWFVDWAAQISPSLLGHGQAVALNTLDREHANLRAALERAAPEIAVQLAATLGRYWLYRGHWDEGRRALERALATGRGSPSDRAGARLVLGNIVLQQGDAHVARLQLEAGLDDAAAAGDRGADAAIRNALGLVMLSANDGDTAATLWEEALAAAEAIGDRRLAGLVHTNRGRLAFMRGDTESAEQDWLTAAAITAQLGDIASEALVVSNLGQAALQRGDAATAELHLHRAVELARTLDDRGRLARASLNLAGVAYQRGDAAAAVELCRTALELAEDIGDAALTATALRDLSMLSDDAGEGLHHARRALAMFTALGDEASAATCAAFVDAWSAELTGDGNEPGVLR